MDFGALPGLLSDLSSLERRRLGLDPGGAWSSNPVPLEAVATVSAGKGVVRKLDSAGHYTGTPVLLGEVDEHFVEITENLDPADWIFAKNPRFLRDDDKVTVTQVEAKVTSE